MKVYRAEIADIIVVEPKVFGDRRGFFLETWSNDRYREAGIDTPFVQDNLSFSRQNTLRGLHFQIRRPQAKLVQIITGEVYDVAVDIRPDSPTFGQWSGFFLSESNRRQVFIPGGFAHGFCVLSETAHFHYKCSEPYDPGDEGGILWSDPDLDIDWPVQSPVISDKDARFPRLSDLGPRRLYHPDSRS